MAALLPEAEFRLYAVCARYPHNLANELPWEPLREGVYQCRRGTDVIRVIVTGQLSQEEHNAPLHLFSASAEQVDYGVRHYRQRSEDTSTLLQLLFQRYQGEGLIMPYTMEDFRKDYVKEHFKDLTEQEQLEAIQGLAPEVRLEGLSVEEIEQFLKKRKAGGSSRQGKPRPKK